MSWGKALVAACLCAATFAAVNSGWEAWQLRQPGFHERDCWFYEERYKTARCGIFTVLENRQDPESRTIRLPVVILGALDRREPKEPILYLTGGPGGHAYLGESVFIKGWREEQELFPPGHDLVILGQRGTGLYAADFDCEEFQDPAVAFGAHPPGRAPPDLQTVTVAAARACAERLSDEGVDLSAYNSRESAADIAELRRALGIEEWSLYGVSYGTRLALSALRYHPEGIRAVVLDSVYPPEASNLTDLVTFYRQALERVFAACAEDAGCTRQYGDLAENYARAAARLRAKPVPFELRQILPGSDLEVSIDDRLLDWLLFDALYAKETRELIPVTLREAAGEDNTVLLTRVQEFLEREVPDSSAVYLSHVCHDETPFESPAAVAAAIERAGPQAHLIRETWDSFLCDIWPAGRADPVENTAVESGVPTLLLAGAYDPITRASLAEAAAAHLANGYVFELARAGHGVLYESPCAKRLTAAFLANPQRRPGDICLHGRVLTPPEARAGLEGPQAGPLGTPPDGPPGNRLDGPAKALKNEG